MPSKKRSQKEVSAGPAHRLPPDLRKALGADTAARAAWEDITPLARNEWICWAISVRTSKTRKEHVARVVSELKEGMWRPCCWPGCAHRSRMKMKKNEARKQRR